jgi:repressor LexA
MSPKQKEILEFIEAFSKRKGYAPTHTEIAKHVGITHQSTVHYHVSILQKEGYLKPQKPNAKRSAQVMSRSECLDLPLLGLVAAGLPIEAVEIDENFSVPQAFMKNNKEYFCLRVEGDSMVDEFICDKDIVLIRRESTCENGDIVVGVIDGKATLKKFKKTKSHIELLPANKKYKPIIVDESRDFRIAGIYSGLFRF